MSDMTPSKTMTAGEINKACANYRAMLEKSAGNFSAGAVQKVLGDPAFAAEQFSVFRRRVEAVSNLIVRTVKVDRTRTPQEVLDATSRLQYTNSGVVVNSMPKGEGDQVRVFFFKPEEWEYTGPGFISDDDLEQAFKRRGYKPADPFSLAKVNEDDPTFSEGKPNGTHWKNTQGEWCCAVFYHWLDRRRVLVPQHSIGWDGRWWFAGLRKSDLVTSVTEA